MREVVIEEEGTSLAEARGWVVLKLAGGGKNGKPDRVYLRSGVAMFIEYKAPKQPLKPLQEYWRKVLVGLGFDHHTVDSIEQIREVMESYG